MVLGDNPFRTRRLYFPEWDSSAERAITNQWKTEEDKRIKSDMQQSRTKTHRKYKSKD